MRENEVGARDAEAVIRFENCLQTKKLRFTDSAASVTRSVGIGGECREWVGLTSAYLEITEVGFGMGEELREDPGIFDTLTHARTQMREHRMCLLPTLIVRVIIGRR